LLQIMPAVGFDRAMDFRWPELAAWHKAALEVYKNMRGAN